MARGFLDDEPRKSDLLDLTVLLLAQTEKAVCVWTEETNAKGVWLPKSQCEFECDVGRRGTLTLPKWLATAKGLA